MASKVKSDYSFRNSNFNNGKELFIVINFREGEEEKAKSAFETLVSSTASPLRSSPLNEYATILHSGDTNENNETEQPHIHLWCNMEKGASKSTWIKTWADFFGLDETAVQIEVPENTDVCLRYLIHLGFAKTQHRKEEVNTNVPTKCAYAWSNVTHKVAFDLDEIVACKSHRELVELVGLDKYHKAKELMHDLQEENAKRDEVDYLKAQIDGLLMQQRDYLNDLKKLQAIARGWIDKGLALTPNEGEMSKAIFMLIKKWTRE